MEGLRYLLMMNQELQNTQDKFAGAIAVKLNRLFDMKLQAVELRAAGVTVLKRLLQKILGVLSGGATKSITTDTLLIENGSKKDKKINLFFLLAKSNLNSFVQIIVNIVAQNLLLKCTLAEK